MKVLPLIVALFATGVQSFAPHHPAAFNGMSTTVAKLGRRNRESVVLEAKLMFWKKDKQATAETADETVAVVEDTLEIAEEKPFFDPVSVTNGTVNGMEIEIAEKEEKSETAKLMQQVKEAGTAGVVSYALWELAFWLISIPVCIFGYYEVAGHWPDLSNEEDLKQVGAEAFAFVNFARFAVPLRIGLALGTTPWIQENIVDRFMKNNEGDSDNNSNNEMST